MAEQWIAAVDYARKRLLSEGWDADRVDDALQDALCACLEAKTLDRVTKYGLYLSARRRAINALKRDVKSVNLDNWIQRKRRESG